MIRYLSVILDEKGYISKPLMEAKTFQIDKFTTKFNSSDEIRQKFKKQIDDFLNNNASYINDYEKRVGKKNNGIIVIIEYEELNETSFKPVVKRVLYKKHIVTGVIKKMLSYKDVLTKLLNSENIKLSEALTKEIVTYIHYKQSEDKAPINRIYAKFIIGEENFYERIRTLVGIYKELSRLKGYPKIEQIHKSIPNKKEMLLEEIRKELKALYNEEEIKHDLDYFIPDEALYLTRDDDGKQR